MTKQTEALKLALEALELAQDNLRPHGDNCFLHDEGEYNSCFCGKDSLSDHLQSVVEKLDEALAQPQQKIEYCTNYYCAGDCGQPHNQKEMREFLASQPQQEPVAWWNPTKDSVSTDPVHRHNKDCQPLYTSPPAQQWTDETANVPYRVWDEKCVAGHCGWPSGCADSERCRADNTPAPQSETQGLSQRKPLTDEELRVIENKINPNMRWRSSDEEGITLYPIEYYELVRAIEAAHGIKGDA